MMNRLLGMLTSFGLGVWFLLWPRPGFAAETCYIYTPYEYQRIGGAHKIGPYPSRSACNSINSSYFKDRGRCECQTIPDPEPTPSPSQGTTKPRGPYTPPQYITPPAPAEPSESEWEREQQAKKDEEERLQQKEAEEKRKREEAQREFERGREELLSTLKGKQGDPVQLKSGTSIFEIKGNPDTGLTLKSVPPGSDPRALPTGWRQLHCGAWIGEYGLQATKKDNLEEAHYLFQQAAEAVSGRPIGVECRAPTPAAPYGRDKPVPPPPLTQFYHAVFSAMREQAALLKEARQRAKVAAESKRRAEEEITRKRQEVERLRTELKGQTPSTGPTSSTAGPPQRAEPKEQDKAQPTSGQKDGQTETANEDKGRLLSEALAALAKAQQDKAEVDRDADRELQAATLRTGAANNALARYEKMLQQVQVNPDLAATLTRQIGK